MLEGLRFTRSYFAFVFTCKKNQYYFISNNVLATVTVNCASLGNIVIIRRYPRIVY